MASGWRTPVSRRQRVDSRARRPRARAARSSRREQVLAPRPAAHEHALDLRGRGVEVAAARRSPTASALRRRGPSRNAPGRPPVGSARLGVAAVAVRSSRRAPRAAPPRRRSRTAPLRSRGGPTASGRAPSALRAAVAVRVQLEARDQSVAERADHAEPRLARRARRGRARALAALTASSARRPRPRGARSTPPSSPSAPNHSANHARTRRRPAWLVAREQRRGRPSRTAPPSGWKAAAIAAGSRGAERLERPAATGAGWTGAIAICHTHT